MHEILTRSMKHFDHLPPIHVDSFPSSGTIFEVFDASTFVASIAVARLAGIVYSSFSSTVR